VHGYNHDRPHQSLGDRPPSERFALAGRRVDVDTGEIHDVAEDDAQLRVPTVPVVRPAGVTRWADQRGHISLAGFRYRVGPSFAGELVEAVVTGGLVRRSSTGRFSSPPTCSDAPPAMTVEPDLPRWLLEPVSLPPARRWSAWPTPTGQSASLGPCIGLVGCGPAAR